MRPRADSYIPFAFAVSCRGLPVLTLCLSSHPAIMYISSQNIWAESLRSYFRGKAKRLCRAAVCASREIILVRSGQTSDAHHARERCTQQSKKVHEVQIAPRARGNNKQKQPTLIIHEEIDIGLTDHQPRVRVPGG